jgi:hypothetical protein
VRNAGVVRIGINDNTSKDTILVTACQRRNWRDFGNIVRTLRLYSLRKMPRAFPQGLKPIDGTGFISELKLGPPKEKTFCAGWLAGYGVWQGAAGSLAVVKFLDGGLEVVDREIGPALGEEDEFGEGAFPEEEVG